MANEIALEIEGQHNSIRVKRVREGGLRNDHPDARWFEGSKLGLFLHWGISSVEGAVDLSWGMITGWSWAKRRASAEDVARMMAAKDYGTAAVTPNEYFAYAERFQAERFDADDLMARAKAAGFTYAVLTTRHHDGFALWPSKYGAFNTKNHLAGRDLVREYVDACRKHGLRVGLYYSPPDWYFNRDHMSYMIFTARRMNPELPELDRNHDPCTLPSAEQMAEQNRKYGAYVHGQIDELLTEYGKIDLLWFDGSMPPGYVYPMARIRELQPGIIVNPRMHGDGDFETVEVTKAERQPAGWWEFCTQWQQRGWAYLRDVPYRPLGAITEEYARTLAWEGHYLLNVGPMADGRLPAPAEVELEAFTRWHHANRAALDDVHALRGDESCSTPAVARGNVRYLYRMPGGTGPIRLCAAGTVASARMLDDASPVAFHAEGDGVTLDAPTLRDDEPVRIVEVTLQPQHEK